MKPIAPSSDNAAQVAASQDEADRLKRENDAKMETAQNEMDRAKHDNAAQMTAAQNEADRLKLANDAATAAAQTEADRLKRQNDATTAAAQTEADRLKRENDAQRASAQADLDRAAKDKAQAETEKSELRAQLLTQFNADPTDSRHRARLDRQHVGRSFRHRQVFVAAPGARKTGEGGWHRLRAPRPEPGGRRLHGQRRRR